MAEHGNLAKVMVGRSQKMPHTDSLGQRDKGLDEAAAKSGPSRD